MKKSQPAWNKKHQLFLSILAILMLVCFFLFKPNQQPLTNSTHDLELLPESEIKFDGGLVTISGKIRNNLDVTYEDVTVNFDLLDAVGESLGIASASIDHIYGTNVWIFEAFTFFPFDMDIQSYELISLEGTKTNEIVTDIEFYQEGEMIEGMTYEDFQKLQNTK